MVDVVSIASYKSECYTTEYGERIDEMRLHKLLYLPRRECLIHSREPVCDATIHTYRNGPVLPEIRQLYKQDALKSTQTEEEKKITIKKDFESITKVFGQIVDKYNEKIDEYNKEQEQIYNKKPDRNLRRVVRCSINIASVLTIGEIVTVLLPLGEIAVIAYTFDVFNSFN